MIGAGRLLGLVSAVLAAILPVWAHPDIDIQIAAVTAEIEKGSPGADLFVRRGELHRIHEDWDLAEADFDRAHAANAKQAARDFHVGRMRLDEQQPQAAQELLTRFLRSNPDHFPARIARAQARTGLERYLAAAKDYDIALASNEPLHRPTHYLERSKTLLAAGKKHVPRALAGIDEGLQKLGPAITLQLEAIDLELARNNYDGAIERLDEIAVKANRKETWLTRKAEILEKAGRPGDALRCYEQALEAIGGLPASRRWNRAMKKLEAQATEALGRLRSEP